MNVGFAGVGQMGRPMVDRLLGAGFPVTAFVRRPDVAEDLRRHGVTVVGSVADIDADVLITCMFSDAQLQQAVVPFLQPGMLWVNHVTGSPRLAEDLAAAGVRVVDAPVSGSADDIRAGRLTILVGAGDADLIAARPALAAYGDPIIPVGGVGDGQRIKLLNNLLFTVHLRIAAAAQELGLVTDLSPILHCSGASAAIARLGDRPAAQLIDAARPFLAKDVAVVREVAAELGLDLGVLGELAAWV